MAPPDEVVARIRRILDEEVRPAVARDGGDLEPGEDDWILVGDGLTPAAFYWAALGVDNIDLDLGIALIGEGTEVEVAGNIFINAHDGITVATLTADQVTQIVQELQDDVVPAYYIVNIGYVNTSGQFIIYSGGIIS